VSAGVSWVPFDVMESFMVDVFKGVGVPEDEARVCADVLISADKRGIDSHGVGRLKPIYYDRIVKGGIQHPTTEFEVVRDCKATALVDGHDGMGMVVGKRCMQMAIDKAKEHGLGMVVARNSTHYGFAAYYPLMAVEQGMVGMTTTNARPSIAPTFGVENMLGTNPLVYAMPTDEPFAFTNDYATSVIQRGKIEQWARDGKPCPEGLVINQNGESETDSVQILKDLVKGTAALAPIGGIGEDTGGYKGYGFATVVELLSTAFSGNAFLKDLGGKDADGKDIPIPIGHSFMAIDIECFTDLETFKKQAGDVLRALRASKKTPGAERIYTCGEKEYLAWQERKDKGVPINESVQREMLAMRDELGLSFRFPFETA
jgi:L-2-hydroxycarboxylate dehydrogenase (NAD+)